MKKPTKEETRKKFLEQRGNIDKKINREKSKIIKEKLFSLEEYKNAKTVMFYVSFGSEVYTHEMIQEVLGKKIVIVPKIIDFEIITCEIKDFSELESGKYRILEPKDNNKEFNMREIDIIIVPGAAFDKEGNRIGYGKGYYDRLLKKTKAKRIALCFDTQITDKIENNEWDEKMDIIITEKS